MQDELEQLADLLHGRRAVVLAGAGCSTESGIPDYRGPDSSTRRRAPVQYQEFMRNESARARYWARSAVGWPRMTSAKPNAAHAALATLERAGVIAGVITQNVDGLHHAAGSNRVIELHGSLAWVACTQCNARVSRNAYQRTLLDSNTAWASSLHHAHVVTAPDGDAELGAEFIERFNVPACDACGGIMKPDVVFFGENVPRARVEEAWRLFGDGDLLIVAGSSLTVFSGRRFVLRAVEERKPVVVLNAGPTRADDVATLKVDARLGEVMPAIVRAVANPRAGRARIA
jgi:NAD-dependent SIR2 family protein deacetylase